MCIIKYESHNDVCSTRKNRNHSNYQVKEIGNVIAFNILWTIKTESHGAYSMVNGY